MFEKIKGRPKSPKTFGSGLFDTYSKIR